MSNYTPITLSDVCSSLLTTNSSQPSLFGSIFKEAKEENDFCILKQCLAAHFHDDDILAMLAHDAALNGCPKIAKIVITECCKSAHFTGVRMITIKHLIFAEALELLPIFLEAIQSPNLRKYKWLDDLDIAFGQCFSPTLGTYTPTPRQIELIKIIAKYYDRPLEKEFFDVIDAIYKLDEESLIRCTDLSEQVVVAYLKFKNIKPLPFMQKLPPNHPHRVATLSWMSESLAVS
jgi:hypothetical protein|tara:strand:- start:131 stop:829 length:699 start_codon:yes stop_codon:yes gene_type:complete